MTPYEHGFLTKCAESGLTTGQSIELMKKSAGWGKALLGLGALAGLPYLGRRMWMDSGDPYQSRGESLRTLMDRRGQLAAKEGLRFSDQGLPGTALSRTWDRMTMGREDFHRKYTDIVRRQVANARSAKIKADKLNNRVYVPDAPRPSSPVAPATGSSNATGGTSLEF